MSNSEFFLIAEDHSLVNLGFKLLIDTDFPGSRIEFAKTSKELAAKLELYGPQLTFALFDLQLEDDNVLSLIKKTLERYEGLYMLVITSSSVGLYAEQLYRAGVKGYINKTEGADEILRAIRTIQAGHTYYSKAYRDLFPIDHPYLTAPRENPFSSLSIRESDILKHLLTGRRVKEISNVTGLKQSTIATYKQRLLEKLHVRTVFELEKLARAHNFLY